MRQVKAWRNEEIAELLIAGVILQHCVRYSILSSLMMGEILPPSDTRTHAPFGA